MSTKNDPDLSYQNQNGKTVAGSAAFLHVVYTGCGGVTNYNDTVGTVYFGEMLKSLSPKANATLEAVLHRELIQPLESQESG